MNMVALIAGVGEFNLLVPQVIRQGIRREIEANSGLFDPDGIKPDQHDLQAD